MHWRWYIFTAVIGVKVLGEWRVMTCCLSSYRDNTVSRISSWVVRSREIVLTRGHADLCGKVTFLHGESRKKAAGALLYTSGRIGVSWMWISFLTLTLQRREDWVGKIVGDKLLLFLGRGDNWWGGRKSNFEIPNCPKPGELIELV